MMIMHPFYIRYAKSKLATKCLDLVLACLCLCELSLTLALALNIAQAFASVVINICLKEK